MRMRNEVALTPTWQGSFAGVKLVCNATFRLSQHCLGKLNRFHMLSFSIQDRLSCTLHLSIYHITNRFLQHPVFCRSWPLGWRARIGDENVANTIQAILFGCQTESSRTFFENRRGKKSSFSFLCGLVVRAKTLFFLWQVGAGGRKSRLLMSMAASREFKDHLSEFADFYTTLGKSAQSFFYNLIAFVYFQARRLPKTCQPTDVWNRRWWWKRIGVII